MSETKKLYRSREDRQIAGVCGGLAEYLNTDTTIIRLLFVVLTLMGGPGLIVYIVLAIVVPEAPEEKLKNVVIDDDSEIL